MPNEVLQKTGTQICFADFTTPDYGSGGEGDFSPSAANDLRQGTPKTVLLQFEVGGTGLANTAARQSAKVDLGATRAAAYHIEAAFELNSTPTAGKVIELYWAPSSDATAANGNPGGVSGSDSDYSGYSSNLGDSVKQLERIGTFICTAQIQPTVQIAYCGAFAPAERYGTLVVKNESGAGFWTDDVESHIVFTPIIDEIQ